MSDHRGTAGRAPYRRRGGWSGVLAAIALLSAGCATSGTGAGAPAAREHLPRTTAETSGHTATSTHGQVVAFIDSLRALGAPIAVGSIGRTNEGRELPYAVASRPLMPTPDAARASGRPIVYVQGNIHGGEVEGKEALQAFLRDLVLDPEPNALDSIVLIAVPIYNADGNERFGPVERQRSEQNGPDSVGLRPNAQGLDLNRDYMKAEAPETRGSLEMFDLWDPDVFVDLHTTDGSYHGYALTYAPSLVPTAGRAMELTRDELLPELRRRMRERHGVEVFDYGNFSLSYGSDVSADSLRDAWYSYDHRPRFGTNYYGLRGGVSILSEAFSHDPFERRVAATYDFVAEILSLSAERAADLLARTRWHESVVGQPLAIRSQLTTTPHTAEVLVEMLESDPDSVPDERGVHRGIHRTGRFRPQAMPVHDRFEAVLTRTAPAQYLIPPELDEVVELLRQHGIRLERVDAPARVTAEVFTVDSVVRAPRPFQAHHETRVEGRWSVGEREVPAGWLRVRVDQPLGRLAVHLLEPESDDGVVAWCCPVGDADWQRAFLGEGPAAGSQYPILRVR
jgi:hypothetical protein